MTNDVSRRRLPSAVMEVRTLLAGNANGDWSLFYLSRPEMDKEACLMAVSLNIFIFIRWILF